MGESPRRFFGAAGKFPKCAAPCARKSAIIKGNCKMHVKFEMSKEEPLMDQLQQRIAALLPRDSIGRRALAPGAVRPGAVG